MVSFVGLDLRHACLVQKNEMTLSQFFKWMESFSEIPQWSRLGQHAFNSLYLIDAGVANKYRATEHDPYHFNDRVKPLIQKVLENDVQ